VDFSLAMEFDEFSINNTSMYRFLCDKLKKKQIFTVLMRNTCLFLSGKLFFSVSNQLELFSSVYKKFASLKMSKVDVKMEMRVEYQEVN